MRLIRRAAIVGTLLASGPAMLSIAVGCKKIERSYEKSEMKKKRMGSFEESAKAVIGWVAKHRFHRSALSQLEQFRESLPFELDRDIVSLLKDQPLDEKLYEVKKGDYVFMAAFTQNWATISLMRVQSKMKLGSYKIYIVDDVYIVDEYKKRIVFSNIAFSVENTGNIYIDMSTLRLTYDPSDPGSFKRMDERIERISEIFKAQRQEVQALLSEPIKWDEIVSFAKEVGRQHSLRPDRFVTYLLAVKLNATDTAKYNGLATEADHERALRDSVYDTVLHEATHLQLREFLQENDLPNINQDVEEMIAIMAELVYGTRRHLTLAKIFLLGPMEIPANMAAKRIVQVNPYQQDYFTMSEEEIKEVAQRALHQLSMEMFGVPFEQVVDVSLYEHARKFADTVEFPQ